MNSWKTLVATPLLAATFFAAGSAQAAACSGISVGTAATGDVTFASAASDQCVISGANPQAGPQGDTSGFDGVFGAGWSLLGKVTSATGSNSVSGVNFAWTFNQTNGTTGTWSLTTSQNATFDLVFAMHAANRSGAFLFDNQPTLANQLTSGTWAIHWLNNGNQVPDFSNLTFFIRDVVVAQIPEPQTYALLVAGLVAVGFLARRRRVG